MHFVAYAATARLRDGAARYAWSTSSPRLSDWRRRRYSPGTPLSQRRPHCGSGWERGRRSLPRSSRTCCTCSRPTAARTRANRPAEQTCVR
ncbi:hypothetical protein HBB16_06420 [Pseudonocardia sp. MCCB 268]|nr:hypothetical protein [Pseudonocardia cytotoxica]